MADQIESIEGINYRIGRLAAMQQLHVVRRVGPVLASMSVSVMTAIHEGKSPTTDDGSLMDVLETAMQVVSKMSNEDVEYVVNTCLNVTQREQEGGRFAPVMNGQRLMFQDVDMKAMVRLTIAVLRENLGGFFPQAPADKNTPPGS